MLYDLNVPWSPQTTPSELERTLRFSQSLGYNVVALNHTISAPVLATITNPIPQLGPLHSSFPQQQQQQQQQSSIAASNTPSTKLPITLRRATVLISDPSVNHRLPTLAAAYDVLAARPTTEKAFLAACTTMSEISLISLDLTTSFPFHFRPKPCMAAIHRGIFFEICYSQILSTQDARARAVFIGNVIEIFRATRGRGIILSSETRNGGGALRAPADVVNLFAVWGLSNEKGLEALGQNPRGVVVNEGLKRRSFRGVVDIVQMEGKIPRGDAAAANDDDEDGNQKQQKHQKKKNGGVGQKPAKGGNENAKQNNDIKAQQRGKRKHDAAGEKLGPSGDADQNDSTAAKTSSTTNIPSGAPAAGGISKRQAKKMKLAQRAVETSS